MPAAPASSKRTLLKVLVPVVVVVVVGFAFWRSVRSARAMPYTLSAAAAHGPWRLTIEMASRPNDPVLLLEPPSDLPRELFDQVFKRGMESIHAPETPGIPLVLAGELERSGKMSTETLLEMARTAGLESAQPVPRCMAHRRQPDPHTREQAYFAMFDIPAFATFRWNLATRLGPTFDAGFVTPGLFVALVESPLNVWLPLHADPDKDCIAPIAVGAGN